MKKEIYTKGEKLLVDIAKAIAAKENTEAALKLDLLLLDMESEMGLIDGVEVDQYGK